MSKIAPITINLDIGFLSRAIIKGRQPFSRITALDVKSLLVVYTEHIYFSTMCCNGEHALL